MPINKSNLQQITPVLKYETEQEYKLYQKYIKIATREIKYRRGDLSRSPVGINIGKGKFNGEWRDIYVADKAVNFAGSEEFAERMYAKFDHWSSFAFVCPDILLLFNNNIFGKYVRPFAEILSWDIMTGSDTDIIFPVLRAIISICNGFNECLLREAVKYGNVYQKITNDNINRDMSFNLLIAGAIIRYFEIGFDRDECDHPSFFDIDNFKMSDNLLKIDRAYLKAGFNIIAYIRHMFASDLSNSQVSVIFLKNQNDIDLCNNMSLSRLLVEFGQNEHKEPVYAPLIKKFVKDVQS